MRDYQSPDDFDRAIDLALRQRKAIERQLRTTDLAARERKALMLQPMTRRVVWPALVPTFALLALWLALGVYGC